MSSSSFMKENTIMSPLTLATTSTNYTTTTTTPTDNTYNKNGLLLEAVKLKSDLNAVKASDKQQLKLRFLVFIEDADGSRFNIFDSAKSSITSSKSSQQINITNGNSNAPNLVMNSSTPSAIKSTTIVSASSSSTSPISSKLNNEMLTRMVFGSFPMVVSNRTAIKVHSLKNSNKTMISNVFVYYNTTATSSSKMNKIHSKCSCNNLNRNLTAVKLMSNSRRESLNQIKIINETNSNSINNTKPIDIIKLNQSGLKLNNNKPSPANSTTLTPTRSNINGIQTSDEISNKTDSNQQQHQSLSSSDVDSTNLSLNTSQNMSPCSSVPTHYGSYSGIYKRLMRSVSNSLISSTTTTNTTIQSHDFSSNNCTQNGLSNLTQNDSINELDGEYEKIMKMKRKQSISIASTSSFSNHLNKENQDDLSNICEKCTENQQKYPKYKIGIAVLFCLPSTNASPKTPTSGPASPPSSTSSNSPNQQPTKLTKNKHSYDPLILFPSLPSMPSSPNSTTTTTNLSSYESANKFNFTPTTSQLCATNNEFYEFFFSHLPLIEYQIKELKEKIILNLPLYFSPSSSSNGTSSTRSSFSSTSQSSMLNENLNKVSNRIQFNQKMMIDFEEYEKNFYSLYSSPRLTHPAWLTLINNRKLANENETTKIKKTKTSLGNQLKHTNSSTALVCNNLINDFVYLNKIINPKSNSSSTINTPNSRRFFTSLKKSFNLYETSSPNTNTKLNSNASNSSFLSVLLSTILKHHLSWVFTVLPSNESENENVNSLRKQRANWTQILEKTNPYNPLWAQLGDLHGAVNHPLKLVRTVLVGKNKELIERLLFLLSYFIRCSNSSYFDISAENFDFEKLPSRSSSGQPSSSSSSASSSSSPNSTYQKTNEKNSSPIKSNNHSNTKQLDFNLEDLNESDSILNENLNLSNCLHLDTSTANNVQSREVNIFDVSVDPIAQLNAVLANTALNNLDNQSTGSGSTKQATRNYYNKYKNKNYFKRNNDDYCMMSLSSSSSIASPSSCSISSSPLNHHSIKMNKFISNINKLNENLNSNRKQRNLSSNSIGENCNAQELPLIGCKLKPNYVKSTRMQDNFGYSLLSSYCDEFVFEFVLHGTSDKSFLNDLYERLVFSKFNSIIDCQIHESIYIVVDVDELDVRVYSSESPQPTREKAIPLVDSLVQSVLDMIKLFQNSEFVLLHLEDKLQELYTKAITLNQLKSQSSQIDDASLINLMELNDSADLDFLNRILQAVYLPNFEIN